MLKTFGLFVAIAAVICGFCALVASSIGQLDWPDLHTVKVFGSVLGVFGGIMMLAAFSEKRRWNNGICREYGLPWEHFDNDSQGGRGYKCKDKTIWVSYPVDSIKAA